MITADATPGYHEQVLPLPANSDAPSIARDFVGQHGADLPANLVEDAQVIVSELVTNAVEHGRPDIVLRLRRHPPGIGVAVEDHGDEQPELPSGPVDPDAVGGRGLLIVDALASHWGVTASALPPGKTVWFELEPGD
jgi:anti-sigma regulatory factor (Ser/Thr protein kinase)